MGRAVKWLGIAERLFLVFFTLAVVIYFTVIFGMWGADWRNFFMLSGNTEMLVYVTLFGFVVALVLKKLLMWEVHLLFPRRRKRGQ